MNTTAILIKMAFSAMSGQSDIFTDAPECAGAVAAAENLQVLAGKLQAHLPGSGTIVAAGHLMADGQTVCPASADICGSLTMDLPDGFDTSGRTWTLTLATGAAIPVAMFTGECGDDESWVIDDAEAFYAAIMTL